MHFFVIGILIALAFGLLGWFLNPVCVCYRGLLAPPPERPYDAQEVHPVRHQAQRGLYQEGQGRRYVHNCLRRQSHQARLEGLYHHEARGELR